MTRTEARIILGLREDDIATEKGLNMLRKMSMERHQQTVSKIEKSKCMKEVKAVDRLLQALKDDANLHMSMERGK